MIAWTNSVRKIERAAWSSLMASSLRDGAFDDGIGRRGGRTRGGIEHPVVLQHARDDRDHGKRDRQEDLPAEPHQLIVAVAGHERLYERKHEEHSERLEQEP